MGNLRKSYALFAVFALLLSLPLATAQTLGDGRWGYSAANFDNTQTFIDQGGAPIQQTFPDAVGIMAVNDPFDDQFGDYDYYVTNLFVPSSKEIEFRAQCCFHCAAFLDGQDVTQFFYGNPGKLTLSGGWNRLELVQKGHFARSSSSPKCNLEVEFIGTKLSDKVDALSSFEAVCDPRANECCADGGASFKPEGTECANGDGKCDASGRCSNADGDEGLCKEQYGDAAFLPLGANNCCGDDKKDCGIYNQAFMCRPGSGWMPVQPNLGKVFALSCAGPVNVVVDQDKAQGCYAGEIPLNYDFLFELQVPRGDNRWEYTQNDLKKESIRDAEILATPFNGQTETKLRTNVYMAEAQRVNVDWFCDFGLAQYQDPGGLLVGSGVTVNGNRLSTYGAPSRPDSPAGSKSVLLDFNSGFNTLEVACTHRGPGQGQSSIRFFPPVSTLVHALSSNLTDDIFEKFPLQHTQIKVNESLGLMEDFLLGVGDEGGGSPFDEDEDSDRGSQSAPTRAVVVSEDQNIKFQFASTVGNPVVTQVTGDLRAIYVGPPPEPPVKEFVDLQVAGQGYLCAPQADEPTTKIIAACAGADKKHLAAAPAKLSKIGDSFDVSQPGKQGRYYCSGLTGKWVTDLDTFEGGYLTCEAARLPQGTETNFQFTGTRCCQDDPGESYNDPWDGLREQHGGCLESKHVDFGDFPLEQDPAAATQGVMTNYLGVFQVCAPSPQEVPQ